MIFRGLDLNGDWKFGKGKNDYTTLNEAIGLNVKTRIRSWLRDCFFAQTAGIDWLSRLGNKNQQNLLVADLRRTILQTEQVTGITSFDIIIDGRSFRCDFGIDTVYTRDYQQRIEMGI